MSKNKDRIIVRTCVGCILPSNAVLIGQGDYLIGIGDISHYYDYEINFDDNDIFIKNNEDVLIQNGLLKPITENKEQPIEQPIRGYQRKKY